MAKAGNGRLVSDYDCPDLQHLVFYQQILGKECVGCLEGFCADPDETSIKHFDNIDWCNMADCVPNPQETCTKRHPRDRSEAPLRAAWLAEQRKIKHGVCPTAYPVRYYAWEDCDEMFCDKAHPCTEAQEKRWKNSN